VFRDPGDLFPKKSQVRRRLQVNKNSFALPAFFRTQDHFSLSTSTYGPSTADVGYERQKEAPIFVVAATKKNPRSF
jgi:hypothetical protein